MSQRRWTRLTNAFARKWENHGPLRCSDTYYNFCRIRGAGIADHQWRIEELLA
jgi:hypothetical protein